MVFNWESSSTQVLFNSRIEKEKKERETALLKEMEGCQGHFWFSTSGTSGKSKYVALSRNAMLTSAQAVNSHLAVTKKDIWINVLPTFHVGGASIIVRGFLSHSKVIQAFSDGLAWDPVTFVKTAVETKATLSALVPAQVHDLVVLNCVCPPTIRAVVVGGGAIQATLLDKANALGWPLLPSYGLTECSSQVATGKVEEPQKMKVLEHILTKVDQDGFIHIFSPSLLTCYAWIEKDCVTTLDPKSEGWFKTEDRGRKEGEHLVCFGRDADFIKIGGESVHLPELQNLMVKLKLEEEIRAEAIIYAEKNERLGQVIAICIEGVITEKFSHLIRKFNQIVLPFERIRIVRVIDKIPRNHMGKPLIHLFGLGQLSLCHS